MISRGIVQELFTFSVDFTWFHGLMLAALPYCLLMRAFVLRLHQPSSFFAFSMDGRMGYNFDVYADTGTGCQS